MLMWVGLFFTAGTIVTMILLDRRRRRAPIFDSDDVECESGRYLSGRGCTPCPKWMINGKSYGRAVPPACIGKEEDISRLWGKRYDYVDDYTAPNLDCPDGQRLHTSNFGAGNFTRCLTPDQIKKADLFSTIA